MSARRPGAPSLVAIYEEGWTAFTEGVKFKNNPHPEGGTFGAGIRKDLWRDGWLDAEQQEVENLI